MHQVSKVQFGQTLLIIKFRCIMGNLHGNMDL